MRWLKAGVASVLAVVVVAVAAAGPALGAIGDVAGTRFEDAVTYLAGLGIVTGRPDGFHPEETISRAEAVKVVVLAAGQGKLAELFGGLAAFADVLPDHWASGYILVASKLGLAGGFEDGTFRPDNAVTYAQFCRMLVGAAGLGPVAGLTWPESYVEAARRAGIVGGVPGFEAGAPALRGDCAIMAAWTIRNVVSPATGLTLGQGVFGEPVAAAVTISPLAATAGVGESVQFRAEARDAAGAVLARLGPSFATGDPLKSAVSPGGLFMAAVAGTYTVTVTTGGASAAATVVVYGEAVGLRAAASRAVVPANGESTVEVTVEVVDEFGSRVADAEHLVAVSHSKNSGAVTLPDDEDQEAEGGMAVFTVTATDCADVSDVLAFEAEGLKGCEVTVGTERPVASGLVVEADPAELMANRREDGKVSATVVDQDGVRMSYGLYEVTFSIEGPGLLDGETEEITVVAADQTAEVQVSSERGVPGTFTVHAASDGLEGGSASVSTYLAGSPEALAVTVKDGDGKAGTEDDMEISVAVVDRAGHPTAAKSDVTVLFEPDDEGAEWDGTLGPVVIPEDSTHVNVSFHGQTAGKFRIAAADQAEELDTASFECTVAAAEAVAVVLDPDLAACGMLLHVGRPRASFRAELRDEYGNRVPRAGVDLRFEALALVANRGEAWFEEEGEVETGADGRASLAFEALAYVGDEYRVKVTADLDPDAAAETGNAVRISDAVPGKLAIDTRDQAGKFASRVAADEDRWIVVTVSVEDTNGKPVEDGHVIEVEFSEQGEHVRLVDDDGPDDDLADNGMAQVEAGLFRLLTVDGEVDLSFHGAAVGSFSVRARAAQAPETVTAARAMQTTQGRTVVGAGIFWPDGEPAVDVSYDADESLALRLWLLDAGGNPIPSDGDHLVEVEPDHVGAEYRATPAGIGVEAFAFVAREAFKPVYYVDRVARQDVNLSDDAELP